MTRALALLLLRSYPRTWRMRYEEEVRALLDDRAPGWRDVAGLLRGASQEWLHRLVDPVEHPILASVVSGLTGWFGAVLVISLTADFAAEGLGAALGTPPAWVGAASSVGLFAAAIRGISAQFGLQHIPIGVHGRTLSFGPLSATQARRWWTILFAAVVLGRWAGDVLVTSWSQWWIAPLMFTNATEAAWYRQQAQLKLIRVRRDLRTAVREHVRLRGLLPIHLSTSPDLDRAAAEVARLNQEARAAAEAWRLSQPVGETAGKM